MKPIDIFPWHAHFDTGLPVIDAQHRRLVDLLNRLAGQSARTTGSAQLVEIFDELANYAAYHFETEEAIWHQALGDAALENAHQASHQTFINEVSRLRALIAAPDTPQLVARTLEFLVRWLASHILNADRYMACLLRARQQQLPWPEAHQHAREDMGGSTLLLTQLILEMYASHTRNTVQLIQELSAHQEAEAALLRQTRYREFIFQLALRFMNLPLDRVDRAFEEGLADMSRFFSADRAYVFRYDQAAATASNTHEWCAPGVEPMREQLQQLPLAWYAQCVDEHRAGREWVIPDVQAMAPSPMKDLLQAQNIASLLTTPMLDGTDCLGFVGFDSVQTWHHFGDSERDMLKLFANLLVSVQQRRAVADALRDSEARYRLLFEQSHDAMLVLSPPDWRIHAGNPALVELFGARSLDELLNLTPIDLSPPLQPDGTPSGPKAMERLNTALKQGTWHGEWMHRRRDGRDIPCSVLLTRSEIAGQVLIQGSVRDISLRKARQHQLERIAHHDPLTSLPNRVLLADRMQQAMAQAQRRGTVLAIVYIDLDGFKGVNDRYGHDAGDRLLIRVAEQMRCSLRESDTLARLGGDEFVAVLADLPGPDACQPMLERLLEACASSTAGMQLAHPVTASLGVTYYPQAGPIDPDQLVRQADQAMYQAKLAGKNRFHLFAGVGNLVISGHQKKLALIERGLAGQAFVLHYQPKVNMRTGAVVGMEALVRWQHPERGLLLPGEFLPLIQEHPLEAMLGQWVIERALAQSADWQGTGRPVPVSVNVSAHQLQLPGFIPMLRAVLARHPGVAPGLLELEILESSALQYLDRVTEIMNDCLALGVGVALDNFGSGRSALTHLKRLPAQTLKIDRSFVRELLDDPEDTAILQGVLGLAKAFRRTPVAAGIEIIGQGSHLLTLGCELGQGFGIARPMPADQVLQWVATWQTPQAWLNAR